MKLTAEKDIADKIAAARHKLAPVEPAPMSAYAGLGAAALAATAAVLMAGMVIVGPGVRFDDPPTVYSP